MIALENGVCWIYLTPIIIWCEATQYGYIEALIEL